MKRSILAILLAVVASPLFAADYVFQYREDLRGFDEESQKVVRSTFEAYIILPVDETSITDDAYLPLGSAPILIEIFPKTKEYFVEIDTGISMYRFAKDVTDFDWDWGNGASYGVGTLRIGPDGLPKSGLVNGSTIYEGTSSGKFVLRLNKALTDKAAKEGVPAVDLIEEQLLKKGYE